jgi:AcrR family transcriptional regulator
MEMNDRRVRRTRRMLADALVALILEKGYDGVSVREIAARADVAHATFYRHFADKDQLLMYRLEEFVEEVTAFTREPSLQQSEGYLIFKHAQENSALYTILLRSPGAIQVRSAIQQAIGADLLRTCAPLSAPAHGVIPAEVAANHIAGSLLVLIEWWLTHDMPYPPARMAGIYEQLIKHMTLHIMSQSA